jgi:hypothetical protein
MFAERRRGSTTVQDTEAYQHLLDMAARADAEEGIRQGLEDAITGKARPAEEFFADFEASSGMLRLG